LAVDNITEQLAVTGESSYKISYSPVLLSDGSEPTTSSKSSGIVIVAVRINLDDGSSVTSSDDPFVAYFASVARSR
jgi:hypothetical protein